MGDGADPNKTLTPVSTEEQRNNDALQANSNKWFINPDKLHPDGHDESLLDECRQYTQPPTRRNLFS